MNDIINFINSNVQEYVQLLIDDFNSNRKYEKILRAIFFKITNEFCDLADFLKKSEEIDDFINNSSFTGRIQNDLNGISAVKHIQYQSGLFSSEEMLDRYTFFTHAKFTTLSEALRFKNGIDFFYLRPDFGNRIDSLFLSKLNDYHKVSPGVFEKKINSTHSFIFDCNKKGNGHNCISTYIYPCFYVRKSGRYQQLMLLPVDLLTITLISPDTSFEEFQTFRFHIQELIKSPTTENISKLEEPVIEAESDGYLITNSTELIELGNQFIFITTELFIHYFRIYEKWVTSCIARLK